MTLNISVRLKKKGLFLLKKNIIKMTILIEIPDKALATPQYSRQDLLTDLAVTLYQRQVYSLAKAARFVQMNRLEFQAVLAERGVYIHYDLDIDLESLKHL